MEYYFKLVDGVVVEDFSLYKDSMLAKEVRNNEVSSSHSNVSQDALDLLSQKTAKFCNSPVGKTVLTIGKFGFNLYAKVASKLLNQPLLTFD